jgi:Flp pilus assembly protein TadD/TolB-like protein
LTASQTSDLDALANPRGKSDFGSNIYNENVLKSARPRLLLALALVISLLPSAKAQSSADAAEDAREKSGGGRVILVLPFDNRSGNPNLNWIGDSFPDTLNQRLGSAGFLTLTRDDRLYALDHLGLPADFRPSRATTLRIAQMLDADYVIVGSYTFSNNRIQVQAQVLQVNKLHLSAPLEDSAELGRLFDVENAIAWKIARAIQPQFAVAEQTFLSASNGISLTAFENYIRGTDAPTSADRVKHLETAVADAPGYAAAQLALGKELYAARDFDKAAATLATVPLNDRHALEANFYLGLARFNNGKYADAEHAFAFVASRLPLPEVLNDQAVALDRQGKDAIALFQRAADADPNDPDFHYNLAVCQLRKGDFAGAQRNVDMTIKLKPADTEAAELLAVISAGRATTSKPANGFEPTTRIRRAFSEASYREATFQLDQIRALRIATMPPAQQAAEYTQIGRNYLAQGLLPEAEQQFNAAVGADPNNAAAHAGLAQVREQSGSLDDARSEAAASIRIKPGVDAYLILARIDLQKNNLAASAAEVQKALQLEPRNAAAINVRNELIQHGQSFQ